MAAGVSEHNDWDTGWPERDEAVGEERERITARLQDMLCVRGLVGDCYDPRCQALHEALIAVRDGLSLTEFRNLKGAPK